MVNKDEDRMKKLERKLQLAGCVIEDSEGRVLLLHRNTLERQQWETPGGKIEPDEDPVIAAKREAKEELGIEVDISDEIGRQDFEEDGHQFGYTWYRATILSGVPKPAEKKHDRIEYIPWEELRSMENLSLNTKNLVDFHFSQIEPAK